MEDKVELIKHEIFTRLSNFEIGQVVAKSPVSFQGFIVSYSLLVFWEGDSRGDERGVSCVVHSCTCASRTAGLPMPSKYSVCKF